MNVKTGRVIRYASEVEELGADDYRYFLELALGYFSGEISSVQDFKRRLFVRLTGLKMGWRMNFYTAEEREAVWVAVGEKVDLLDSFFEISEKEDGGRSWRLRTESVKNMLPVWGDFKAPDDIFRGLTWGDFVVCMNAQKMLLQEGGTASEEEAMMWQMDIFRAIYKPTRGGAMLEAQGRDIILFHAHNYISYLASLITTVPISVNGEMVPLYEIWQGGDDEKKGVSLGWSSVLFSVAESGVFGNVEDVNGQPFIDVLLYLYNMQNKGK